jgi:hypothetical protein
MYIFIFSVCIIEIPKEIYAQEIDSLDIAYQYYNSGLNQEAIVIFENYAKTNPKDTKIFLQLGFAYYNAKNLEKALYNLEYVINNSIYYDEIIRAKGQKLFIEDEKKRLLTLEEPIKDTTLTVPTDELAKAYKELNDGHIDNAITLFESYAKSHPENTKISLQLAYIYFNKKDYRKSLEKFMFVSSNSKDYKEIDASKESIYILKQMIPMYSTFSNDLYFYNFYDSYQDNYIFNFVDHINFKIVKYFYTGFYADIFMDNRSTPELIYNDRYVEVGAFWKIFFLNYLAFELRTGYVREIDFKKSSFNVKPILTFGYRLGEPKFYSGAKSQNNEFLYADIYSSVLYDYKFKNIFGQIYVREVARFLTGGYSYLEFYLGQNVLGDTKQLDYNNYGEISAGVDFQPGIIHFPLLFIEASNKFYWLGGPRTNSFQIKAGFLLNFSLAL